MTTSYKSTIRACFTGYIVQAIVNNFIPLLFVTFQSRYNIPLSQITLLITLNFGLQLIIDLASAFFVDKIGYRASALLAHLFSALGLIFLAVLPEIMDPFSGLVISVACYAAGGGLLEVIISPIVESCPSDHKDRTMSMLHSFYCWGMAGVVLLSTAVFYVFGIGSWRALSVIWAAVPIVNGIAFIKTPIAPLIGGDEESFSLSQLFKTKLFWVFVLIMCCAGASEQAVSQWASAFVEKALRIPKSAGDLAGPTLFAILMGMSRMIYGKFGEKIDLSKMMFSSCTLCIISYLVISLSKSPAAGLLGIAAAGFSVGILWPGTFSKAAQSIRGGGTAMFAFLALAGDIGCAAGPTFAGQAASLAGDNLKTGILAAVIFPSVLLAALYPLHKHEKSRKQ